MLLVLLIFTTMLFFSLSRIVFLFYNWSHLQNHSFADFALALVAGLRFDFFAVSVMALIPFVVLFVFWRLQKELWFRWLFVALFFLPHLPGFIINLGDIEFVNFTGRRLTWDSLMVFREAPGKLGQMVATYWQLFLWSNLVLLLTGLLAYLCVVRREPEPFGDPLRWNLKKRAGFGLLIVLVLFLGARGGLQKKPLGFAHAQVFSLPMMNNLVMNSAFTILQTTQRKSLERAEFFDSQEQMLALMNGSLPGPSLIEGLRPKAKQNIVLIILESFALEYMGPGAGYTPFLNSLAAKGLFFQNHFANGRRSIEGIGAILGGIPALMEEPFLSSQYMSNYFVGLGSKLKELGYHTSFFHGGENGTFYFDSFTRSLGIDHYFGSKEYPNKGDFDGTWGIFDEPFLHFMAEKLQQFPQPFFSTVFTLSSHNPFPIPEKYRGRFPKGVGDIHESIGYADFALEQFFKEAAQQPWYDHTLFIITADHTYKSWRPGWNNEVSNYRVPLILFHPKWKAPALDTNQVTQQIDILPTILDFVGLPERERNYLARSVFVPGERTALVFGDHKYHLIGKDHFLTYQRRGQVEAADFKFFSRQDLSETQPLSEPAGQREKYVQTLKANIQYFSQGLWDNKIYYPSGR